jgi:nucleotide-binding universal stress UspA family protein
LVSSRSFRFLLISDHGESVGAAPSGGIGAEPPGAAENHASGFGAAADAIEPSRVDDRVVEERTKTMFETIVWATDGSELADNALEHVRKLAEIHGSRIVAVHANELLPGRFGGAPLLADEQEIREKIADQVEALRGAGFNVTLEIRSGGHDVATLLEHTADDVDADLIVVGTHGHGGVAAALMGSVARALCHASHRPVLVVPPIRAAEPSNGKVARLTTTA